MKESIAAESLEDLRRICGERAQQSRSRNTRIVFGGMIGE